MTVLALAHSPISRLARAAGRLIAPRRYAAIGLGAFLVWLGGYLSLTVNIAHRVSPLSIGAFVASAAGLLTLLLTATPRDALGRFTFTWGNPRVMRAVDWTARALATLLLLAMAVLSLLLVISAVQDAMRSPSDAYMNDVISFSAANAHALLAGRNPYTDDANFAPTLIAYPHAPPTPIQSATFGFGYDYPNVAYVFAIDKAYVHDPARYASAFEPRTLHSYPALSFLIYLPLFLLGIQNVMWLNVAAYLGLLGWMIALAERDQRGWVGFTGLAAFSVAFGSLLLETELLCLLFLLPAWALRERRGWLSALLLGLGCALKQYCWFFAPLYLLDAWLRHGWREAGRRALVTLAAFLAPNLPFIILSPAAWWQSLWLPLSLALFPQGMGLVTLALGHLLPPPPKALFTALEIGAVIGTLWLYARYRGWLREAAPLLALIPLFFAFRSPQNYFAVAPWLALFAWLWLRREPVAAKPELMAPATPEAG